MAIYAADSMDQNIGRLMQRLNKTASTNTIMFMSDNGACAEWHGLALTVIPEPSIIHM